MDPIILWGIFRWNHSIANYKQLLLNIRLMIKTLYIILIN